MGTIQDISAETILKKQLAEEEERRQNDMRNLFEVIHMDQNVFAAFDEDAEQEFARMRQALANRKISAGEKLINIYQSVHAVKSNALIVGLAAYGEKLHGLEEKIKIIQEKEGEISFEDMNFISQEVEKPMQAKEEFPEILNRLRNFNSYGFTDSTAAAQGNTEEALLSDLKKACSLVAADENKKVNLLAEKIDPRALSCGPTRVIKDVLTQLIRNSVHHGIEIPADRLAQGKNETGKITVSLTMEDADAFIRVVLSDDGRGLDYDRIEKVARKKGILNNVPVEDINRSLLSNILFSPGFSTSENENIHGGRGIGLNLVRDRLREVKGTIGIKSKKGQGLVFDLKIPTGG
jgi:two-component system chemotaxis sensor kinase CheA